ncbi:MAG: flippase-like domain-containing protein [Candidatus Aminicenantes bacterium]|nr:flippase-like domain-containing protein [Candidatus Aminicenantes bacterium]
MKKNFVRLGLISLLTIVFLFFFFQKVEWREVLSHLKSVNLIFFILLILLVPLHLVARSIRWKYLLKHEKSGVKFYNMFAGNAVGFTVTLLFPGRLGELVRPLYLAQKEKMSKGFAVGTVVVERIFDVFTMCSLLGLFLLSKPFYSSYFQADDKAYSDLQTYGIIGVAFAFLLLVIIFSLYFFKEKTLSIFAFFLKPFPHKISQKILENSEEFIKGLKFFHSVGNLFMYILLSFVVWLGIVFYYWLFFFAYKISMPYFFLFPYVFLTMVGAAIPTPGMIGGFHFFSRLGLTSLYNIDENLAVGMTIVIHAIQVVVTCLIGYAILWKEGISLFQIKKIGEDVE